MRILHVTEAFAAGILEVLNNLSTGLVELGHEVAIAYGVRPETPSSPREVIDRRVELVPTAWTRRTPLATLRASRQLRGAATRWSPDVIHLHSSFAGVVGAASLSGLAPTVYSPHGYSFTMNGSRLRRGSFRTLERLASRRVEMVGAVSEAEADLARQVVLAPRVEVVRNGIPELDSGAEASSLVGHKSGVVALGRVTAQRRPQEVAQILAAVTNIGPVAWVGGAVTEAGSGTDALELAGIPITGWLNRGEALERLSSAAVYLHWTAWDGMPLSILEALARDVVVIASDIPVNREILGSGQVFASMMEAAGAIRRTLQDDAYREALLGEQRRRRTRYGSSEMINGWESLYRTLVAAHDGRPLLDRTDSAPRLLSEVRG